MSKLILVIIDGLRFDVAQASMGYLAHFVEVGQASRYKVQAQLPSVSRPIYEVLLTGTPCSVNGITSNQIVRLSQQTSLFHLATAANRTTAAAAYYFFSELYNRAPFDPFCDREQHDSSRPIQHGKFYWEDDYPDSHVFADAEVLRQNYEPDFLLVHPCGMDSIGHQFGGESSQYRNKALEMDNLLAQYLPRWRQAGYQILITADHGMNADGQHGGTLPDVRDVPLFCFSPALQPGVNTEAALSQLAIAPLVCRLLDLPLAANMQSFAIPGLIPGLMSCNRSADCQNTDCQNTDLNSQNTDLKLQPAASTLSSLT
ncbi:MAG: alkaline phosphatase family protein [Synechococcales cyanobacterium M58_A2018_015]|nr:alkaline phosphatase family protein [Synechococcales cyanobacterium M58_A2018_015]